MYDNVSSILSYIDNYFKTQVSTKIKSNLDKERNIWIKIKRVNVKVKPKSDAKWGLTNEGPQSRLED